MEGMPAEEQGLLKAGGPAGLDEGKIMILRRSVNLVPDKGMTGMGKVNANLVHPPRLRVCADERERAP